MTFQREEGFSPRPLNWEFFSNNRGRDGAANIDSNGYECYKKTS